MGKRFWVTLLLLGLFVGTFALAEETPDVPGQPLVVRVAVFPPLVIAENGSVTGFDIDLWKAVANELGWDYRFEVGPFYRLFDDIESGEADIALAGITITEERERRVDFSHQYLESGLRILVRDDRTPKLFAAISRLFTPDKLRWAAYLLGFIVLCGHLLWFAEKGGTAIHDRYVPGIFEAFWCVVATVTTVGYGDITPKTWLGRIAAFGVMVTGITFFGVALAQISAGLTLESLETDVQSLQDLHGKRVATVQDTTSVPLLRNVGARFVEVETIEDAYPLLLNGEVDAIVFDAPPLLHYAQGEGQGRVALAGETFERQYYGIALREGSPLLEPINRALLHLRENGTYDTIYAQWFGVTP